MSTSFLIRPRKPLDLSQWGFAPHDFAKAKPSNHCPLLYPLLFWCEMRDSNSQNHRFYKYLCNITEGSNNVK